MQKGREIATLPCMKHITDPVVLAEWELKDGEILMLSTSRIESGQAHPLEDTLLAYGYTKNGGPTQYRPLGACNEEGMPLANAAEGGENLPPIDGPAEQVSPPSDGVPPQIEEIPLPEDEHPPAPPVEPLPE